jgi:DNA-binding FrmR family transcriptional regulator
MLAPGLLRESFDPRNAARRSCYGRVPKRRRTCRQPAAPLGRRLALYSIVGYTMQMAHTIHNKDKLAKRVARIRGQVDAVARALEQELECGEVLRRIASARGAMNSLMAEVLEDHIREHAFGGRDASAAGSQAADELIEVVRSYLR